MPVSAKSWKSLCKSHKHIHVYSLNIIIPNVKVSVNYRMHDKKTSNAFTSSKMHIKQYTTHQKVILTPLPYEKLAAIHREDVYEVLLTILAHPFHSLGYLGHVHHQKDYLDHLPQRHYHSVPRRLRRL